MATERSEAQSHPAGVRRVHRRSPRHVLLTSGRTTDGGTSERPRTSAADGEDTAAVPHAGPSTLIVGGRLLLDVGRSARRRRLRDGVGFALVERPDSTSGTDRCREVKLGGPVRPPGLAAPPRFGYAACVVVARSALNATVAVDTTALVVTTLLDTDEKTGARGRFRLVTVDDVLSDASAARTALMANSPGHLVWDEQAQTSRFIETDESAAAMLAAAAATLVRDIEQVRRLPRPTPRDMRFRGAPYSPWIPLIDLPRTEGTSLWSDDVALRTLARAEGVPAFSTLAVLQVMAEDGIISERQGQEIDRTLIRGFVGDLPILTRPGLLMELAEEDRWLPGSVGVALGRPAAWADLRRTLDVITPLMQTVTANAPQSLPGWAYRLVRGAAYAHLGQPATAHLAIAPLLASLAYMSGVQGPAAATLVAACRAALHETGYELSGAQDPVPTAAQLMYGAMSRILPRQTAAQYMLGFAASLDSPDRDAIARMVLVNDLGLIATPATMDAHEAS